MLTSLTHPLDFGLQAYAGLPEYNDLDYKDAELAVLRELDYCLQCPM
jgi:hypothetical protein